MKVYGARTSTRLTLAKTTITYGHENAEKFTVSVSGTTGNVLATGKVTVKVGRTTLCTITLSRGSGAHPQLQEAQARHLPADGLLPRQRQLRPIHLISQDTQGGPLATCS